MTSTMCSRPPRRRGRHLLTLVLPVLVAVAFVTPAEAATPDVVLGTAGGYSVLAGSTVTNTGPSTVGGELGLAPGSAVTGFPPGHVAGATHVDDTAARVAKSDLTAAYIDARARTPRTTVASDLGGTTLVAGVYGVASSLGLTGTVTLDGGGHADAVFIFVAGSSLVTASASRVSLIGDAQACHVFWVVGSSATLGSGSLFQGTIMALTSITLTTQVTLNGRALARNGAVTLDDDVIRPTPCANGSPTSTSTTTTAPVGTTTTVPGQTNTIPRGAPATGFGGAAGTRDQRLVEIGEFSVAAGAVLAVVGMSRRLVTRDSARRTSSRD